MTGVQTCALPIFAQLLGQEQRTGADARGDGLRERRRVDHAARGVEVDHARHVLPSEAEVAVRVVLEDPEAVLGGEVDEALAHRERRDVAGRVLEVRDDVDEAGDLALRDPRLELLDVDAVLGEGDRVDRGAEARLASREAAASISTSCVRSSTAPHGSADTLSFGKGIGRVAQPARKPTRTKSARCDASRFPLEQRIGSFWIPSEQFRTRRPDRFVLGQPKV